VTGNAHVGDMLSIFGNEFITVSGSTVSYDADGYTGYGPVVQIGTLSSSGTSLTVALNADADNAAVEALTEAIRFSSTDATEQDRTVHITLRDGDGTANGGHDFTRIEATVHVAVPNQAPVILTDDLQLFEEGETTTLYGLSVSDTTAVPGETFTVSAITAGAPGSTVTVTPPAEPRHLVDLNAALEDGVTYAAGASPPPTDMVTFTVADSFGASDTVNFIFNLTGTGPVTLQGTALKDVILATGYVDTLTGGAGADQFVFTANTGHDTVTDFTPGQDRIDLFDNLPFGSGSPASFNAWITSADVEQLASGTLIHLDAGDSILLSNVSRASLHINDFILHPGNTA
jgi:hypothetical protein